MSMPQEPPAETEIMYPAIPVTPGLPEVVEPSEVEFPPAPWRLHGTACVSLWRVPARLLPEAAADIRYVTLAGQALVVTAWVNYQSGGTLAYDELAVAALVRGAGRYNPACTVTHIWVDSPVSAAGGRQLWAIPKQLAEFDGQFSGSSHTMHATAEGSRLASLSVTECMRLPGSPPLRGFIIQRRENGLAVTRCRASGNVRLARASWDFPTSSPLAFLAGRKPLTSMLVTGLNGAFGL